ncbi:MULTISPECIES: hypothetical protein [Mycolicibacter]|uniref:hypothetical protein n=1 Tax=Mycolicibacter TaxID=1073531 RepID=UPI0007EF135A|nr:MULTISPECIES: hypothetical protein [Mycolicibacter]OBJ33062.1 hypothetical protein A5631_07660 [Mycolicibacter heraklionensis]ULP48236.1 hypothetical protein MJO54_03510 [Mycolicibacter virginiensis]
MDESIVAGRGGFRTRAELMQEAVENLLNELDYPDAPPEIRVSDGAFEGLPLPGGPTDEVGFLGPASDEPVIATRIHRRRSADTAPMARDDEDLERRLLEQVVAGLPSWERNELTLKDLAGTALVSPERKPKVIAHGAVQTDDEPLLGLHSRDYPSVWALQRMARYTTDGLKPFEKCRDEVLRAAWYFGGELKSLERYGARLRKLTVLFPTNIAKQPSAARGFQSFAVGSVTRSRMTGLLVGSGPLFAWGAIQAEDTPDMPAGLTESGWRLISELDGLSLDLPHPLELTDVFMAYLAEHAPADRWGFDYLLRGVAELPTRNELVERFRAAGPKWSDAEASSVAQGYIARSREWGLVEPRLVDGRYWLTAGGRELLERTNAMDLASGRQK